MGREALFASVLLATVAFGQGLPLNTLEPTPQPVDPFDPFAVPTFVPTPEPGNFFPTPEPTTENVAIERPGEPGSEDPNLQISNTNNTSHQGDIIMIILIISFSLIMFLVVACICGSLGCCPCCECGCCESEKAKKEKRKQKIPAKYGLSGYSGAPWQSPERSGFSKLEGPQPGQQQPGHGKMPPMSLAPGHRGYTVEIQPVGCARPKRHCVRDPRILHAGPCEGGCDEIVIEGAPRPIPGPPRRSQPPPGGMPVSMYPGNSNHLPSNATQVYAMPDLRRTVARPNLRPPGTGRQTNSSSSRPSVS